MVCLTEYSCKKMYKCLHISATGEQRTINSLLAPQTHKTFFFSQYALKMQTTNHSESRRGLGINLFFSHYSELKLDDLIDS